MEPEFQFRNVFNTQIVTDFSIRLKNAWNEFDDKGFINHINPKLDTLQYGERSALITDALKKYLPQQFPQAVHILLDALGPELQQKDLSGYNGFIIMPQCRYISKYGLNHFDLSMKALYELTKRFTAEGDLGYFIESEPQKTFDILFNWAKDPNCHVRRLVSEGTRPRLPLGRRLRMFQKDPKPVIQLLELLKNDPELYVRRSVANNMNDISKDNPEIAVDTLKRWNNTDNDKTRWLVRHASRTLVKQGNKEALELLGFPANPQIKIHKFKLNKNLIEFGGTLEFSFTINSTSNDPQNLMIDYIIHFMKANGKTAPKVFKISKQSIAAHENIYINKTHTLKPLSTRVLYPGIHHVELLVNGDKLGKKSFSLTT